MTTESDVIDALAQHLEATTDYEIETEEHGVIVNGDFQMFDDPDRADVDAEVTRFFGQRMDVSGYSVSVITPAGETTGNFIIDQIQVVPNA